MTAAIVRVLVGTVMGFAVLYVLATAMLFAAQRRLIYPAANGFAVTHLGIGYQEAHVRTSDGLELKMLHRVASDGKPTLLFFHGNGDTRYGAITAMRQIAAAGYGVLLAEYRGYPGNPGSPSEAGLYLDGEAAVRWLAEQDVQPSRVVLVGNSLGSGVATELATRHQVAGLVLVSGFTSLVDVAAQQMRLFPVRLLLRDQYDNLSKLPRVVAPVMVLHGTADALIPAHHGERLAGAARRGELMLVPGVGHELAYLPQSQAAVLRWLERLS